MTADAGRATRIASFDNLKYFLIVLVVVGHYIDPFAATFPGYAPLFFFIYLFHMPLFVFSTGLFAQSLLRDDGGFRAARVLHFLVLYLGLYAGVWWLETLNGKAPAFTPWSVGNASWYLLACALWYLAAPVLTRAARAAGSGVVLAVLVAVALAAGYFPAVGDFLSLSRVLCFAPFFFLGLWTSRDGVTKFAERLVRWRVVAVGVLLAALALAYAFPALLKLRGILTARNSYAVLHGWAGWGAGFRLAWMVSAVVLGIAVLALVPRRRAWFTALGGRTLPIYVWHLLALRGLALVAFIPLVRGWSEVTPLAVAVPLVTALVAAHVFALKPPFGVLAEALQRVGSGYVLGRRAAVAVSAATLVAVPAAAFAVADGPRVVSMPRGLTPWIRQAPAPPATPPSTSALPTVTVEPGDFELGLVGARGFAVAPTTLEQAGGLPGGELAPGEGYVIRKDEGATWLVETRTGGGRLPAASQMVNLPDLVPSIDYVSPAPFTSAGTRLPGLAGPSDPVENPRLGRPVRYVAVAYPLAIKLQRAQQAARAHGDLLVVHEGFRPAAVQRALGEAVLRLYETDPAVEAALAPWSPSDVAPLALSNHSLGVAVDVSLARVTSQTTVSGPDGDVTRLAGEEYSMPTAVHDLSRAAAALAHPVKLVDGSEWRDVQPAGTLTDGARRLRGYLTEAGLAPSPAAWWEFTDWDARRAVPASSSGDFALEPETAPR